MRLLLDTHSLLFWAADDAALSTKARRAIASAGNQSFLSAASIWEIAVKTKSGKMNAQSLLDGFDAFMEESHFEFLPIGAQHAITAGSLPLHHRDPFDRMLAAQAQLEQLVLVSRDEIFDGYGVPRLW